MASDIWEKICYLSVSFHPELYKKNTLKCLEFVWLFSQLTYKIIILHDGKAYCHHKIIYYINWYAHLKK